VIANIALCLIHQANYLIDRQLLRLEKDFLAQGGLRERMLLCRPDRNWLYVNGSIIDAGDL
jgi:four helix bundle suffix protein